MILIVIKFCELLLRISQRIINSLWSYIKHSKEYFLLFPNTSKLVKKTWLRLVFPTYFSVFGNWRKHSSSCLIYYFKLLSHLFSCKLIVTQIHVEADMKTFNTPYSGWCNLGYIDIHGYWECMNSESDGKSICVHVLLHTLYRTSTVIGYHNFSITALMTLLFPTLLATAAATAAAPCCPSAA